MPHIPRGRDVVQTNVSLTHEARDDLARLAPSKKSWGLYLSGLLAREAAVRTLRQKMQRVLEEEDDI